VSDLAAVENTLSLPPARFRVRFAAWIVDSFSASFVGAIALALFAPDLARQAVAVMTDPDASTALPGYLDAARLAAFTLPGAVLGSIGLRSPGAALTGLVVVSGATARAGRIQHLLRGAACAAIYVGFTLWTAFMEVLAEFAGPRVPDWIPDWFALQLGLTAWIGGCGALLLAFLWTARDKDGRTLYDIATGTRVVRSD
jgi:hypothetical protein